MRRLEFDIKRSAKLVKGFMRKEAGSLSFFNIALSVLSHTSQDSHDVGLLGNTGCLEGLGLEGVQPQLTLEAGVFDIIIGAEVAVSLKFCVSFCRASVRNL